MSSKSKRINRAITETLESRVLLADATLVKDVFPGPDSGSLLETSSPYSAVIGSKLIFAGVHPTLGRQVFASDGTATGTDMVRPGGINPSGDANPGEMVAGNGKVYFVANDGGPDPGPNIWVTEGTYPTTKKLTSLASIVDSSGVNELAYANGAVFFKAGGKLYKTTDAGGQTLVSAAAIPGSHPLGVGNTLFYEARDAANGSELWSSDGSSAHLVANIRPGDQDATVSNFVSFKGKLYFTAHIDLGSRQLYSSDGVSATPVGSTFPVGAFPSDLTVSGSRLYFVAKLGEMYQIWVSDGAAKAPVSSFTATKDAGAIRDLTNVNGTLFFTLAQTGVTRRLYKIVDGTTVTPVGTESGGPDGGLQPGRLAAVGSTVFFNALDTSSVARLFQSDGNPITLVKGDTGTDPSSLVNVNGTLIFNGNDSRGQELHAVVGAAPPDKPRFTVRLKAFEEGVGTSDGVIDEGATMLFQAVPSEDVKGTQYRWDFDGNGSFVSSGKKPLHRYIDNLPGDAVRNVRVKVTAPDGRIANATFALVVNNVKPTIKVQFPPVTSPGAFTPALITVSDPGENDELKVDINWDDGQIDAGQVPIAGALLRGHVFKEADLFGKNVRFSVRDKDSAEAVKKKTVSVQAFVKIDPIQIALDFLPGYLIGGGAANNRVQVKKAASQPDPKKESLIVIIDNAIQQVISVDPATEVLQIFTGDGNDRVDVDAEINTRFRVYGGDGNDTLRGGTGRDTLYGQGGRDSLDARGGKNTVKQ